MGASPVEVDGQRDEDTELHVVVAWRMKKIDFLQQFLAHNFLCVVLR